MKKVISTSNAPAAIGPYSQAIQVGNMLFMSGQLGIDPSTGAFFRGWSDRTDYSVFQKYECYSYGSRLYDE